MIEDSVFLLIEISSPREQGKLIPDAIVLEGLNSWAMHCSSIHEGSSEYYAGRVVDLLKQFANPMLAHMEKTMIVLDANLLKKYTTAGTLQSFEVELETKSRSDCLPFSAAPLLILNAGCTHNPWYPPAQVPGPVILALRHIVIPLNSETWKFSQCDTYMRP
ncbi:unnamed protein product [Rhizoctonia solani]|uniref:Uncharacterized protein n=1 Tax=Rhizoctonia solani AG-3 Rhs1AP TaxID=1086054 RepID=X8JFG3_9AGAM|nr:hypothetical protein RSOL_420220 [Rhizoctonia solani AG-3 Rhs1AP]CAE6472300.1 unnamed protein product [Rhizoctonia solani]